MSVDATRATWKLSKKITAIQKLLLLALADRAGENGECWPGISRLIADTNLDRHTIVDNRKILIQKGYIELTGELKGRTKSIPVMRLTYVKNREGIFTENQEFLSSVESNTASKISSVEMPTGSSVESNTASYTIYEPKKEPIISSSEEEAFIISKNHDEWILRVKREAGDTREDEEILKQVKYRIDNRDKTKYNEIQTLKQTIKWIAEGSFGVPAGFETKIEKKEVETSNLQKEYHEYCKRIEADIYLGLLATDIKPKKLEEWKNEIRGK